MKARWSMTLAGWVLASSALAQPYGMGPGMMGGWGPGYGMGPGMMGGGGWGRGGWGLDALDLSAEQRAKIAEIRRDVSRRHWDLMRSVHEQDWHMGDAWRDGAFDEKEARKAFEAMNEAHRKMFEASIEARKRIDAVLTPQQREQLRKQPGPR
jgi:Spy/CpxP family protein refolding chaperone